MRREEVENPFGQKDTVVLQVNEAVVVPGNMTIRFSGYRLRSGVELSDRDQAFLDKCVKDGTDVRAKSGHSALKGNRYNYHESNLTHIAIIQQPKICLAGQGRDEIGSNW